MMQRVAVAIEAAKTAGAALRVAHERDLKVEEKKASRTSIVTSADLQSQDIIFGIIRRAFPDDAIFGEEGNDGDERAAARWYVDPLDGTTNFSHRFPFFLRFNRALRGRRHQPRRRLRSQPRRPVCCDARWRGVPQRRAARRIGRTPMADSAVLSTRCNPTTRRCSIAIRRACDASSISARRARDRRAGIGPRLRVVRLAGRVLRGQYEPVGHAGWYAVGPGSGRHGDGLSEPELPARPAHRHSGQQRAFASQAHFSIELTMYPSPNGPQSMTFKKTSSFYSSYSETFSTGLMVRIAQYTPR